jgi:hypothetical protein
VMRSIREKYVRPHGRLIRERGIPHGAQPDAQMRRRSSG